MQSRVLLWALSESFVKACTSLTHCYSISNLSVSELYLCFDNSIVISWICMQDFVCLFVVCWFKCFMIHRQLMLEKECCIVKKQISLLLSYLIGFFKRIVHPKIKIAENVLTIHHKMLIDGLVWITCGLLWCFYQLFGLSFWRHPFTAEDPLVSKWCNATFLQICSDELWANLHF